jgi:hypothetical protein
VKAYQSHLARLEQFKKTGGQEVDPLAYGVVGVWAVTAYSQISLTRTTNALLCQRTEVNFERIHNKFQYSLLVLDRRAAMSQEAFSFANGVERGKIPVMCLQTNESAGEYYAVFQDIA